MSKYVFQKIGFIQTLEILSDTPMYMKDFYEILKRESYYNAFYRIKDELLEKRIIKTATTNKRKKIIALTQKGMRIRKFFLDLIKNE